jgi:hypothetical protein
MHILPKRGISFRAGIAEFLLILRLKSRRRGARASDIPERAARIILVTCKNWFTDFDELAEVSKRGGPSPQRCMPL